MKNFTLTNKSKKVLVGILTGAMILASATAVSAAGFGSRYGTNTQSQTMGGMMETYTAKTNALSYSDLTGGIVSSDDLFSKRDLKQNADLSEAQVITVKDGQTITITE